MINNIRLQLNLTKESNTCVSQWVLRLRGVVKDVAIATRLLAQAGAFYNNINTKS